MPAHDPRPPLPQAVSPLEQRKALEQSKVRLLRHAILSAGVALFFIGFNAAFTRETIWFPWPVAALIILWLIHLQKHLANAKHGGLSFNVWMDEDPSGLASGLAQAREKTDPALKADMPGRADPHEQERPRRRREWLE